MNLTGKVAVVTGGGRDIGKMTSIKLASLGAKVVINYFGAQEEAEHTQAEIAAAGGEAILVQGDMTNQADVDNLVEKTIAAFGSEINILVNVAGGLVARKTLAEMDEDFINFVVQTQFQHGISGNQSRGAAYACGFVDCQFCFTGSA